MSQIRCVYTEEPIFPATDQHQDAVRYSVAIGIFRFADCIGGAPTQSELEAHLGIDAAGLVVKQRIVDDETEAAQAKIDAQIQADLNLTAQGISDALDAIFPLFTAPQKAFMRRLTRMAQASGRKVLR